MKLPDLLMIFHQYTNGYQGRNLFSWKVWTHLCRCFWPSTNERLLGHLCLLRIMAEPPVDFEQFQQWWKDEPTEPADLVGYGEWLAEKAGDIPPMPLAGKRLHLLMLSPCAGAEVGRHVSRANIEHKVKLLLEDRGFYQPGGSFSCKITSFRFPVIWRSSFKSSVFVSCHSDTIKRGHPQCLRIWTCD